MADNDNNGKKKKSIIASLDLKNYKAKYKDTYGLGKPDDIDLDNFLVAEPDTKNVPLKPLSTPASNADNDIQTANSSTPLTIPKSPKTPTPSQSANSSKSAANVEPVRNSAPATPLTTSKPVATSKSATSQPATFATPSKPAAIPTPASHAVNQATKPTPSNIDSDFERRVFAEAENDFFDDKPPQNAESTFKSSAIKRNDTAANSDDSDTLVKGVKGKRKLNLREPVKVNVRHEIDSKYAENFATAESKEPLRKTETYGIAISIVALLYSIFAADKSLLFLAASLLMYLLSGTIAMPFGKHKQAVQNAIRGFSIALFFGALFFTFF